MNNATTKTGPKKFIATYADTGETREMTLLRKAPLDTEEERALTRAWLIRRGYVAGESVAVCRMWRGAVRVTAERFYV